MTPRRLSLALVCCSSLATGASALVAPSSSSLFPSRVCTVPRPTATATDAVSGTSLWGASAPQRKRHSPSTAAATAMNLFASVAASAAKKQKSEGKKRLASGMAFLTGWADVALFTKYRGFATMMSGNTLWMASAFVDGRLRDMAYYASVILSYWAGLAAFRRTDLTMKKRSLPLCALAVTALFVGSDYINCFADVGARWAPMMMLAAGFGIINSVGSEVSGTLTFVITGHMTRLVNQFVDRFSTTAGKKKLTEGQKEAVVMNSSVCASFFGGAALAAALAKAGLLHKFGVFSAIGALYGSLWLWQDMEFLGGAWWLREDDEFCDIDDDGSLCEKEEKK